MVKVFGLQKEQKVTQSYVIVLKNLLFGRLFLNKTIYMPNKGFQ